MRGADGGVNRGRAAHRARRRDGGGAQHDRAAERAASGRGKRPFRKRPARRRKRGSPSMRGRRRREPRAGCSERGAGMAAARGMTERLNAGRRRGREEWEKRRALSAPCGMVHRGSRIETGPSSRASANLIYRNFERPPFIAAIASQATVTDRDSC